MEEIKKSWYDKNYKILFVIPVLILILSLIYLGFFYYKHNDFILKDVSLSGGTTITLNGDINASKLNELTSKFPDVKIRTLTDSSTGKHIATIIESSFQPQDLKQNVEKILGFALDSTNSSTEFSGPVLSQSFYSELLKIVFVAFILMALVIFLIFGASARIKAISIALTAAAVKLTFPSRIFLSVILLTIGIIALAYGFIKSKNKKQRLISLIASAIFILLFIFPVYYFIFIIAVILFATYLFESLPSVAVIFAAFGDIVMALAVIDYFQIRLSAAGLAAFLMLIGYSVDTDILLTTRALKKHGETLNKRIFSAFKTGAFMTTTALLAVLPAFFIVTGLPSSFRQIFLILALGLSADLINTWLTNASIIKWYCEKRGIR